jgi:hypothetical protein
MRFPHALGVAAMRIVVERFVPLKRSFFIFCMRKMNA